MLRLDSFFKDFSDGVCVADERGNVLYINPAARHLLIVEWDGVKPLNLQETLFQKLSLSGAEGVACPLAETMKPAVFQCRYGPQKALETSSASTYTHEDWRDLRIRSFRISTEPFGDEVEGEKFLILLEDISSELNLERHKDEWRNMIAHDLKAPLTSITGTLSVLAEMSIGESLDKGEMTLIRNALDASRRMLGLINLFLEVAQLDSGVMPVSFNEVSVGRVVKNCLEDQSSIIRERRVQIDVEVPENSKVWGDEDLLLRILGNILNNALKFTPIGGNIRIRSWEDPSKKICISLKDNGTGIPSEDLPYIFDRFHQAQARQEGRIIGNGLGLTFCQEALKAMKGDISVSSTLGSGSEFVVRLDSVRSEQNDSQRILKLQRR